MKKWGIPMKKTKGIDVSKWQGRINFGAVKAAGYKFVMLRLGYGADKTEQDDELFVRNVKECEKHGLDWGAYLYSYALNTKDAESEADHAIRVLQDYKPTYPIAFDMEDADGYKKRKGMPSNETLVNICDTFLKKVEDEGYYVCLYASKSWLENQLLSQKLDRYDKWVAQWNKECTYTKSYGIWQYTNREYIRGISGYVDANLSHKDYPEIIKANGLNGWPKKKKDERYVYHVVKKGDTLSEIAKQHDTTYMNLAELNNLSDPNLIYPGQKILIKVNK